MSASLVAASVALALSATPAITTWSTAVLVHAAQTLGLRAFVTGTGRCPQAAEVCVGIVVHPVVEDDAPVQTPLWFSQQIAHANRLFAAIGVGFEVADVVAAPPEFADLRTREQRDLLGRKAHTRSVVHVFLVRRLADVDIEGEIIRGVHWRDRIDTSRRWVILSSVASHPVLAHELGHFFGLPHSRYPISIMNKNPAPGRPSWPDLVFHPDELDIMGQRRDAMLADGTLEDRAQPPAAAPRGR